MTARMLFLLIGFLLLQTACESVQEGQESSSDQYKAMREETAPIPMTAPQPEDAPRNIPPPPPPPAIIEEIPSEEIYIEGEYERTAINSSKLYEAPEHNSESYDHFVENTFQNPLHTPLSTFSVDVDNASYSNIRRFLNQGRLPPKGAVRLEEMINYFDYDYPNPMNEAPFSVINEVAVCPWNSKRQLVHIGLQAKDVAKENLPPGNLVFLLDVSGSMNSQNKLPLLKNAFKLLTNQLRSIDRVAIIVYAGASGLVLPSTSGDQKQKIRDAILNLKAGGSTAGASGIRLAYAEARKHFVEGGNNRVILATDGDFNIGVSSQSQLVKLIEEERKSGIFLSVLGFGTGNYQDAKMEKLADNGNGNYAYIDRLSEARKVLVNEFSSTLFTVAKDVKLQIEFNPAKVKAYRLIGYENRILEDKDFNDDQKDAGDIGAGHTVTALYEIIPKASSEAIPGSNIDPLKYQNQAHSNFLAKSNAELMTVKLRYKEPQDSSSKLLSVVVKDSGRSPSTNLRFSAAVANFGMLLRDSAFKGNSSFASVRNLAQNALGNDPFGYRREFLDLIDLAELAAEEVASR